MTEKEKESCLMTQKEKENKKEENKEENENTRERLVPIGSNNKKNYYGQVHLKAAVNGFSSSSTTDSIRAISSSPSTFT